MIGTNRGKTLLLLGLLVAWGAIVGVQQLTTAPPPPPAPTAGTGSARRAIAQGVGLPRLKTELLRSPRPPVPTQVQNIFGKVEPPPPPKDATKASVAPAPPPPPPPPDPFLEAAKRLRYLGFVEHEAKRKALILQGQDIQMVEAGEAVGGQVRVKTVNEDYVLLASPDGSKEAKVELRPEPATSTPALAPPRGPGLPSVELPAPLPAPGRPGSPAAPKGGRPGETPSRPPILPTPGGFPGGLRQ